MIYRRWTPIVSQIDIYLLQIWQSLFPAIPFFQVIKGILQQTGGGGSKDFARLVFSLVSLKWDLLFNKYA